MISLLQQANYLVGMPKGDTPLHIQTYNIFLLRYTTGNTNIQHFFIEIHHWKYKHKTFFIEIHHWKYKHTTFFIEFRRTNFRETDKLLFGGFTIYLF